jgi:hypothetical protein
MDELLLWQLFNASAPHTMFHHQLQLNCKKALLSTIALSMNRLGQRALLNMYIAAVAQHTFRAGLIFAVDYSRCYL